MIWGLLAVAMALFWGGVLGLLFHSLAVGIVAGIVTGLGMCLAGGLCRTAAL